MEPGKQVLETVNPPVKRDTTTKVSEIVEKHSKKGESEGLKMLRQMSPFSNLNRRSPSGKIVNLIDITQQV